MARKRVSKRKKMQEGTTKKSNPVAAAATTTNRRAAREEAPTRKISRKTVVKKETTGIVQKKEKTKKAPRPTKRPISTTPTKGKSKVNYVVDGKKWSIRFGERDIVSVYTGSDEDADEKAHPADKAGKVEYRFVQLCADVIFGDDNDEYVEVQWLVENDDDSNLRLEDDVDLLAIGSFICSVTAEVVEQWDGSFVIPEAAHAYVRKKLELQLSDDYNPDTDQEDIDYEQRTKKKRKLDRKSFSIKSLSVKVKTEDEYQDKTATSKSKSRKKAAKDPKPKKKSTNAYTLYPRPNVSPKPDLWHTATGKIASFNGDTHRASKEAIRAYLSNDKSAFKKIISDKKFIANVLILQSCNVKLSVLDYAILAQDEASVKTLWKEFDVNSKNLRPEYPTCTLNQLTSGRHTSRFADYNRRQVGASRGGAEGNNAFLADMSGSNYTPKRQRESRGGTELLELMRTHDPISVSFLDFLNKNFFASCLINHGFDFYKLVIYGNCELARHAMTALVDKGVGLTNLYADVMGDGDNISNLDKVRSVSVVKLTQHYVRFCPIHCAASNPNPIYIKRLLAISPDAINSLDSHEAGLLHYAAVGDKSLTLEWLLSEVGPGTSLNRNAKMRKGLKMTPLMMAAQAARSDNIPVLCEGQSASNKELMFTTKDSQGRTPLHIIAESSRKNRIETARALLTCGADPNVRGDVRLLNKQTPLMICASRGELEMIQVMVEHGADLKLVDKLERTLVMFAAKDGHVHVLSYLLREGVSADAEDSSGNTAMHYAAAYGWVECINLLLEVGAPPDPRNSWSSTPLELSLKKGRYACAVVLLNLEEKVDVNVVDKTGVSLFSSLVDSYMSILKEKPTPPLPWAIKRILECKELKISLPDSNGCTVLHLIASNSSESDVMELLNMLLVKGADPLVKDKQGCVALQLALQEGNLDMAKRLLEYVFHSSVAIKGHNPMHLLVKNISKMENSIIENMFMLVFKLLNDCNKGWVAEADHQGRTPLLLAADCLQQKWNSKKENNGQDTFEKLMEQVPLLIGDVAVRKFEFRKWSDDKIVGGEPNWTLRDEYNDGSRSVLHAVIQCKDIVWVDRICRKAIQYVKQKDALKLILNLKGNDGLNVAGHAINTFVFNQKDAPEKSIISLLKFLYENGADMNTVPHPLFSSIEEARQYGITSFPPKLDLSLQDVDCKLKNAHDFILHRERMEMNTALASTNKKMKNNNTKLSSGAKGLLLQFQPYLHKILTSKENPSLVSSMLHQCGFQTNVHDIDGNLALHVAVIKERIKEIQELARLSDVNAINAAGKSPLILAKGKVQIVKTLIEHGADVYLAIPKVGTALHAAVIGRYAMLVELLLKTNDTGIDKQDEEGRTPLHHAVSIEAADKLEMLKPIETQLIDAGADINAKDMYGRTPLHYAFIQTSLDTKCKFPVANGAARDPIDMLTLLSAVPNIDLNVADSEMRTPMHFAAGVGASICILYLCDNTKGVEIIDAIDSDDNTPLALALLAKQAHTSVILISKDCDINVQVTDVTRKKKKNGSVTVIKEIDRKVNSTLWCALTPANGPCASVARYMLASHKKMSIDTILVALFSTGNFQLAMKQIKSYPKDVFSPLNHNGLTELHRLAQVKSFNTAPEFAVALADLLINCGVNPNRVCSKHRTAIHYAAYHGHTGLVRHLIKHYGVSLDIMNSVGGSPMTSMFAGSNISLGMLLVLIEFSTDEEKIINSAVSGGRNKKEEDKLTNLGSVATFVLDTPKEKRRYELEVVAQLQGEAIKDNTSSPCAYTVASTVLIESVRRGLGLHFNNVLLLHGIDGTKCDEQGRTSLHHAVLAGDISILSLLLSWSPRIPINNVDNAGHSAMSYAVLLSLRKPSLVHIYNECISILLTYGANPLVGGALLLATEHNKELTVKSMIRCMQSKVTSSETNIEKYNIGDIVWVRFGGISRKWSLAKVCSVEGDAISLSPYNLKPFIIIKVSQKWVCKVESVDVCKECKHDTLVSLLENKNDFTLKEISHYDGFEVGLEKYLRACPERDAILSKLKVGDQIGHVVLNEDILQLYVGHVEASHPNGTYNIQLLSGISCTQVPRIQLRRLRNKLCITSGKESLTLKNGRLGSDLVFACVRPMWFGSFENMSILRELVSAGAPTDCKNTDGKTPLDLARIGSEIESYLRSLSGSSEKEDRELKLISSNIPSLDGIDINSDAEAALNTLHSAGADITEQIIPKVNPVCELDSVGVAVLQNGNDAFFEIVLTKVDVEHGAYGKYVFYRMQIVHDPIRKVFVLLTNWGRIGCQGKYQQTPFTSREKCILDFGKVFRSKTGNKWEDLESFQRVSGKYTLVRRAKTRLKNPEKLLRAAVESSSQPCTLAPSVADLFRYLIDVNALKSAVSKCSIDEGRSFGQLSLTTLNVAETKLKEIKNAIENKNKLPSERSIADFRKALEVIAKLSNEFYELLPICDEIVRPFEDLYDGRFANAVNLILQLRDLTITKQILLGALHRQSDMNPIDYAYKALQINIQPLDSDSIRRKCVQQYIDNTCNDHDVVVHQIYALDSGKPQCSIPNKRLLFHGSKNSNIPGILKHGLLIAPPEAPATGFMYGKGVYFADQFSKAFSYTSGLNDCTHNGEQPRAFIFVAEVALGESYGAYDAEYMEESKEGTSSTHAIGSNEPDSHKNVVLASTGAVVPLGPFQITNALSKWKWLNPEANLKIEDVRLDPNTAYPATVCITHKGAKSKVTLDYGPDSKIAIMRKIQDNASAKEIKTLSHNSTLFGDTDLFREEDSGSDTEEEVEVRMFDTKLHCSSEEKLTRSEHHSRGRTFSEFIVYDTSQIRLVYMIEVTSKSWIIKKYRKNLDQNRG